MRGPSILEDVKLRQADYPNIIWPTFISDSKATIKATFGIKKQIIEKQNKLKSRSCVPSFGGFVLRGN